MVHKVKTETVDQARPATRATVSSGNRGRPIADLVEQLEFTDPRIVAEKNLSSAALRAGDVVRRMRKMARLSQSQLAEQIGVKQSRISEIESGVGSQGPTWELMERIAAACDRSLVVDVDTAGQLDPSASQGVDPWGPDAGPAPGFQAKPGRRWLSLQDITEVVRQILPQLIAQSLKLANTPRPAVPWETAFGGPAPSSAYRPSDFAAFGNMRSGALSQADVNEIVRQLIPHVARALAEPSSNIPVGQPQVSPDLHVAFGNIGATNPIDNQASVNLVEDMIASSLSALTSYLDKHSGQNNELRQFIPQVAQAAKYSATRNYWQALELIWQTYRAITILRVNSPQTPPVPNTPGPFAGPNTPGPFASSPATTPSRGWRSPETGHSEG
jgi:transcriptional regulator with XRE-family HTH domain